MNKVILMGRLTRNPEVRYSQAAEPLAIARYSLAVNRNFRSRDGEPDADFINIVAFGKRGEFAEKYFKKGQLVAIVGHLQVRSYDDKDGNKRWSTEVVVDEQHFAESKKSFEGRDSNDDYGYSNKDQEMPTQSLPSQNAANIGFQKDNDEFEEDDDLPF